MAHQHLPPQPCPDLIAQDEVIEMPKYAAPNEGTRHASEEAHELWNQAWDELNHHVGSYRFTASSQGSEREFTSRAYEVFK